MVGLITSRYLLGVDYVKGGFLFRISWVGVGVLAFCVSLHFDFTFFFSPSPYKSFSFFFGYFGCRFDFVSLYLSHWTFIYFVAFFFSAFFLCGIYCDTRLFTYSS